MSAWVYFAWVQLVSLIAQLAGFAILLPFCVMHAWETSPIPSIKPGIVRGPVDRWRSGLLDDVYGNPEDGVSGQTALVWGSGKDAGRLVPYWPSAPAWLRAYAWSAWRNSAGGLKYEFQWRGELPAPFKQVKLFGFIASFGWKPENGDYYVPVFSIRRS